MLKTFKTLFLALSALMIVGQAQAAEDPIYTSLFSNSAVGGYDPVAYFTESKPVEGKKKYQTKYKGANWYFASQENLDTFLGDPEKYAPQYGGYCAWAVSEGKLYKGDPHQWTVLDGKLYLNFDAEVQARWNTNRDHFIVEADKQWPNVLN